MEQYSVLMSVYRKENQTFLKKAIESILVQTVLTDDFVLVCDGPLTPELDATIERYKDKLNIIRLPQNVGLGRALNEGMKRCRHDLIARMDSDDISRPERCEKQLTIFANADVDIVSAALEEFSGTPDKVEARRVPPETHEEILGFAQKRNPFNHPCVMYKKSAVLAAGGYQDFYLLEDYYLWIRMLLNGCKGYNIQEPLLWMRAGSDMYKRRAGWKYARSQQKLFGYMRQRGFITTGRYIKSCLIRTCSSCAPNWMRESAFKSLLRK